MTGKEAASIATKLETAHAAFDREVSAIGERARTTILPYFAEHKLTYMAGNGTWYISGLRDNTIDDKDLPKEIRDTLWLCVGHGNRLGFYIPSIKPADWRVRPATAKGPTSTRRAR